MTSQVRNLWCRSQNKMGPSSKYVSSQHLVDLRQPQVAMKHHLRSVKNTCVAQSLYSEFRPLNMDILSERHLHRILKQQGLFHTQKNDREIIHVARFIWCG